MLAGARSARQVEDNLRALDRPLPGEVVEEIDAIVDQGFGLPRASTLAVERSREWGERERFIVERRGGRRTA